MKIINISFTLIILLIFTLSCQENFLNETAFSTPVQSAFPKSSSDLDMVTAGIYAEMDILHVKYGSYFNLVELNSIEMCYKERGDGSDRGATDHYTWNRNISFTETFVRNFYTSWEIIRQCNDVLGSIPNLNSDVPQQNINRAIGEAKAFRAWVYFDLIRLYGDMPVIDKSQELTDNLFVERPGDIRVNYNAIIKDLQDAIELLPARSDYINDPKLGQLGRMTKHAAMFLLAKAYISMNGFPLNDGSKLTDAKTLLDQIVASKEYELQGNYADVFSVYNEQNKEILFALAHNQYQETQNFGITGTYPGNSDENIKLTGTTQDWQGFDGVPNEFAYRYKSSDAGPRYQYNIILTWYDNLLKQDVKSINYGNAFTRKYFTPPDYVSKNYNMGNVPTDLPLLRYADVLLSKSEVENELNGPSADALDGINQVRKRAQIYEYQQVMFTSKEQLRDSIFWERNLELCFEQHGVYDLRRRGYSKLREIVMSKLWFNRSLTKKNRIEFTDIVNGAFDERMMLYPIPPLYLNQNPKFAQNPGY